MKVDERHLIYLAAVVEAGGVTEGANMIGQSQPAVSRTLALLEKRVGEPLFVHGRRPLLPTALGQQLAIHGRAILSASRRANETINSFKSGSTGRMRVGGVPFFMDAIISQIIASFQTKEPGIYFNQSYGHYNDLIAELTTNEIDIAVTPAGTQEISAELVFDPLLPARNVVACSAVHPLLSRKRLLKSDFLNFPWVSPLPGSPLMLDLTNILLMLGINELSIRYAGGSLMSVVNYLMTSNALALMPLSVVRTLQNGSQITFLPLQIPQPERMIGIAYRRQSAANPVNRKFISHVKTNLDNLRHILARNDATVKWQHGPFMHNPSNLLES
jgi:DNA-binding transcriptional LysR family regulator